jgi:uncharacterized protein (DUF362 family)
MQQESTVRSAAGARPRIAILRTRPETVLDDVGRLMEMAGYRSHLPKDSDLSLKVNITWHKWFPGCSTTPWQLEGVIRRLLADGYETARINCAQNSTVVVDTRVGEVNNRLKPVLAKHGIRTIYLNDPDAEWIPYRPKGKMLVLDKVYPKGIRVPRSLIGESVIHLPTVKTHVFTTITGSMKNAFGGLLHFQRHWTHAVIHETLVDLLMIQKEIHTGIFTVTDGVFCGDGPGPRAMRPHIKNVLLAGADSVAIDAVQAKIMGFDPLTIPFIRIAHEKGLGVGDIRGIEIVGEDISAMNFGFHGSENTFASRGQKAIYHGFLKPLEHFLLRSPVVPWSYAASKLYHDAYWYNVVGKRRIRGILDTEWGRLFQRY